MALARGCRYRVVCTCRWQPSALPPPRSEVPLQHTALGEKVHGVPASGAALGAVRPWRLGQGGFSGMPRHPKPTSRHGNVVLVHLTLVRLPNCQRCSPLSDRPPGSPQLYLRTLPLFGPLHPNRLDEPWRNRGSRRSSSRSPPQRGRWRILPTPRARSQRSVQRMQSRRGASICWLSAV